MAIDQPAVTDVYTLPLAFVTMQRRLPIASSRFTCEFPVYHSCELSIAITPRQQISADTRHEGRDSMQA